MPIFPLLSLRAAAAAMCLTVLPCLAAEQPPLPPADPARLQILAQDPAWLRLLHMRPGHASEVLSPEFFLSPTGRSDAAAELLATVNALTGPQDAALDAQVRCRFPARTLWLTERLALPTAVQACPAFEAWAQPQTLRSASLTMASGFLGNPASSFGHSLLKLNHEDDSEGGRLLDLSFNFGARVPDGESMASYLYKGLLGGYDSAFSSGAYYVQDQVYARTEFRDLWEYELRLTAAERLRLAAHLWELREARFTYYFLTKNCAYRLAEMLTVATGQPYTPAARVWYTPVELFHSLLTDTGRSSPLVAQVRFEPSSQRLFYAQFQRLNSREAVLTNQLIAHRVDGLQTTLAALPPERRLEVIETLLAYFEYRLAAQGDESSSPQLRQDKDTVLRARLALPPRSNSLPEAPARPAPTTGARGMLVGAGVIRDGDANAVQLRYAPYLQDLIGRHRAGFLELAVLDTEARVVGGHVALDRLDIVRVRKLALAPDIVGEQQWSWQARAGVRRERLVPVAGVPDDLHAQVAGGVGRALALSDSAVAYASVDGVVESSAHPLRGGPTLGFVTRGEGLRFRAEVRGEYDLKRERWLPRGEAELGMPLLRDLELRAVTRHDDDATSVSVALYSTW